MQVYVITTDSYSDYAIQAICSTRELAELLSATLYDANEIEEWEVDGVPDEAKRGLKAYRVWMNKEAEATAIMDTEWHEFGGAQAHIMRKWFRSGDLMLYVSCWARDEQHAAKIANEIRAQIIASDSWRDGYEWKD